MRFFDEVDGDDPRDQTNGRGTCDVNGRARIINGARVRAAAHLRELEERAERAESEIELTRLEGELEGCRANLTAIDGMIGRFNDGAGLEHGVRLRRVFNSE